MKLASKPAVALLAGVVGLTASVGLITTPGDATTRIAGKTSPGCIVPHGGGPGYNATINNQQNDKTICITVGERLLVLLTAAPANTVSWGAMHVATKGILKIEPLTIKFVRGTTAGNFDAAHPGTTRLTSQRSVCAPAPSGAPVCDAIELWQVTLVVRATSRPSWAPSGTGIYGIVTAGPTCPVERVGQPCPPRPVGGEVEVRNVRGQTVASTHTDSLGRYSLSLKPGRYALAVLIGSVFPRCPSKAVAVTSAVLLRADISCDTGIR